MCPVGSRITFLTCCNSHVGKSRLLLAIKPNSAFWTADLAQDGLRARAPAAVAKGGFVGVVPGPLPAQPLLSLHALECPGRSVIPAAKILEMYNAVQHRIFHKASLHRLLDDSGLWKLAQSARSIG